MVDDMTGEPMSTAAEPPEWPLRRDVDAVAAHLETWIRAGHAHTDRPIPLLGTPEWAAADQPVRDAAVAIYVLACLTEQQPVVLAARLAAEIAAGRSEYRAAIREASIDVSTAQDWRAYGNRRVPHDVMAARRARPGTPSRTTNPTTSSTAAGQTHPRPAGRPAGADRPARREPETA